MLTGLAGLLLIGILFHIGSDAFQNYNYWSLKEQAKVAGRQGTMIDFGPPGFRTPGFHLFSLVLFLSILVGRRYIGAMVAVIAYFILVLFSFNYRRQSLVLDFAQNLSLYEELLNTAYPIDLLALILLSVLAIWLLTIFWRFGLNASARPLS